MSGVVVLFDRSQCGLAREEFTQMHDRLAHRGPDGRGTWYGDGVALGHQQLESTPEAAFDDQPIRDTGLVLTADARIDNRDELIDSLSARNGTTPVPDSQLLLESYQKWGENCVEHLAGSFSFVVWDRSNEQLFCARDHFGVKPLYYHLSDDVFAIASEKKGLLELTCVSKSVDKTKIGDFLVALYEDKERTFFESVRRLPPAHAMTVCHDEIDMWQYWDLDPTRTVTYGSDAAYEHRFRELFEQAVRSRLRAKGPVGTALSGGMDSSSITVVARDLLPDTEPLHTFSNVYDDAPSSDEREFIETMIDRDGIESHYVFPEDTGMLVDEEQLRTQFDQPPHNTMHFAVWERTKRAAAEGVEVVLDGALGDSAIGYGLGLLPELLWTGRWPRLYHELRSMSDVLDASTKHLFVRHVLSDMVPEPIGQVRRWINDDPRPLEFENPTLNPAFIDRVGLRSRYRSLQPEGATFTPRARRLQCRSLLTGRNATNFEALDLVGSAFGVEPRYPFTDKRLVEFSLAIPPSQQFSDGWTRSIGRRALDDLLPEKVQWRPWKTPTSEAFWNALSYEDGRLETLIEDLGPLEQYLDAGSLRTARNRFNDERNSRDGRALWRALSLSVWLDEVQQCNSVQLESSCNPLS